MTSDEVLEIARAYATEIIIKAKRPLEAWQIANHIKLLIEQYITDRLIERRMKESREEIRVQSHKRF